MKRTKDSNAVRVHNRKTQIESTMKNNRVKMIDINKKERKKIIEKSVCDAKSKKKKKRSHSEANEKIKSVKKEKKKKRTERTDGKRKQKTQQGAKTRHAAKIHPNDN